MLISFALLQKMRRWANEIRARKQKVVIIYASVTGNTAKYASDLGFFVSKFCIL